MATWNRLVSGSTAGNVSLNIDYAVTSVTRTSNTNVKVTYGIRFSMATSTYTYNSIAAFCPAGGSRYYAFNHSSGHTNKGTYYYANTSGSTTTSETCPFTQNITVSITQTSASFEVGYGWDAYQPSQKGKSSITVTFPTGATAPTGLSCSVSGTTETSCTLSGSYSSNGNATVTATGYQYKKDGGSWTNCSSSLTGLSPSTKYYFRYYATNSQGTSYSDGSTNTTTYGYPYCTAAPSFKIGDDVTLSFYNPLNRSIQIQIWSHRGDCFVSDLISTSGTSYTGLANIADRLYASIPNNTDSGYNVDVHYGSNKAVNAYSTTYSIKGTEKPTFSASNITNVVDTLHVNDITGNASKIIKGHNKITGNITKMTPLKSAGGSRYVVTATANPSSQELSYDSGATKSFTLENLTVNSFSVTAYDTRGLSTPVTKTVDLIDYNIPKVNNLSITRQNGIGEYAIISANGTFTNWGGWSEIKKYNSIQKVYMRFKPSTESNYGEWKEITHGLNRNEEGNWNIDLTLDDLFTNTLKYDFQLYVQDLLESSVVLHNTLSTANGFLWRDIKYKRLGINKKPERTLDVNGDVGANNFIGNINGLIWDTATNNTDDTWVPVFANQKMQHRVIPTTYNTTSPSLDAITLGGATVLRSYKFVKSLKLTTEWQDVGIHGNHIPTGVYLMSITGLRGRPGATWQDGGYWGSMLVWFDGGTNAAEACEYPMYHAIHAHNGDMVYMRTISSFNGGNNMRLQLRGSREFETTDVTFRFTKLA